MARGKDEVLIEGIEAIIKTGSFRRFQNDWTLGEATIIELKNNFDKELKPKKKIRIKGSLPNIEDKTKYKVVMNKTSHPTFGLQYLIVSYADEVPLDGDEDGQREYLERYFTSNQVNNMYRDLGAIGKNPFQVLLDKDVASLVRVKGCEMKTAVLWIKKFESHYDTAKIIIELSQYKLTNAVVDKLLDRYKSPDVVIEKVKKNPYILCTEVKGIGWKTADKIALESGINRMGTQRIEAYIRYLLDELGESGQSWTTDRELISKACTDLEFGEDEKQSAVDAISIAAFNLIKEEILDCSPLPDGSFRIGLMKYKNLSQKIVKELLRIEKSPCTVMPPETWKEDLKHLETVQGFEFSKDEQLPAIEEGFKHNVFVVTGGAGTGKTSIVAAILNGLKNYTFAQCALSGRAGARMQEVTGTAGYTIHRLLKFPKGDKEKGMYVYHDENPLPYWVIIMDEMSMPDARMYYNLLRAIPDGGKVIMIGDVQQLEPIGCGNVASDIINSGVIPVARLTKIHRQAEKSAIVTESLKVTRGEYLIPKGWAGIETRGEMQDLTLNCYSDSNNTFTKIMETFLQLYSKPDFNLMETQIIVPNKSRTASCTENLNNAIQEIVMPRDRTEHEEVIKKLDKAYFLRVGDKVINTRNNYEVEPEIFNGNIGIIKSFETDVKDEADWFDQKPVEVMVVDFLGIGEVRIPKANWSDIELGYALTVHKVQGSEFNNVIVGIDMSSYILLTRELLYTAITRAKKHCYLVAQNSALNYCVMHKAISQKRTYLLELLIKEFNKPCFIGYRKKEEGAKNECYKRRCGKSGKFSKDKLGKLIAAL